MIFEDNNIKEDYVSTINNGDIIADMYSIDKAIFKTKYYTIFKVVNIHFKN